MEREEEGLVQVRLPPTRVTTRLPCCEADALRVQSSGWNIRRPLRTMVPRSCVQVVLVVVVLYSNK